MKKHQKILFYTMVAVLFVHLLPNIIGIAVGVLNLLSIMQ
jgi:hypothetical protein